MKMTTKRKFDKAFKLQVVRRSLQEDITIKELSEELQIASSTLTRWRKEFLSVADARRVFPGHGRQELSEEQRQITQLQRELKDKELELEILKKAIRIFSREEPISTSSFK